MHWVEIVEKQLAALKPVQINTALLERIVHLTDLTRLVTPDSENNMAAFLEKANTPLGHVAAVCVYPEFISLAKTQFTNTSVKVATVVNFPEATSSLETTLIQIGEAIANGAQEIDVVFPYQHYLAGEKQYAQQFISACKAACGDNILLKVILETGVLMDITIIADASWDALAAGADFLKTSTGKVAEGASLEAAAAMLLVIQHALPKVKRKIGIKISGGIKTIQQAAQYLELAANIMGRDWINATTFRFGASQLLDEILAQV